MSLTNSELIYLHQKNVDQRDVGEKFGNIYQTPKIFYTDDFASNTTSPELFNYMDLHKIPSVNRNILDRFNKQTENNVNLINSEFNNALNNPYLESQQIASQNFKTTDRQVEISKLHILSMLRGLKSVYISNNFPKNQNIERLKKFNLLIKFFSNISKSTWQIDSKGILIYKSLNTGIKFSKYIDYFIKFNEKQSYQPPIYFSELFVGKILRGRSQMEPLLQRNADNIKSESGGRPFLNRLKQKKKKRRRAVSVTRSSIS